MSLAKEQIDLALLKQFSPLDELDGEKLLELAAKSTALQLVAGDSLGEKAPANSLVFLLAGSVERLRGNGRSESVGAQTDRARYAIMSPQEHVRVVARSEVAALCVDSPLLEFLLACSDANDVERSDEDDDINARYEDWVDGLIRSDVVANLSPASIQALLAAIEPVDIGADEMIFAQGDAADFFYIVSRGRCVVTRREMDQESLLQLAALGPGSTFGEEALVGSSARNATVKAVEESLLLRVRQETLKKMFDQPLVKVVDQREVSALRGKGAVMLYVHLTAAYVKSEKGITIPYSELRFRMRELDAASHYVVVSDNSKVSAAAAFLLIQNRFQVSLPKTAASSAAPPQPLTALERVCARFENDLADVHERLRAEQRNHAATKERLTELEIDLEATRAGAKAAMAAASEKRMRAELALRNQIGEITTALEREKNSTLAVESNHAQLAAEFSDSRAEMSSRLQSADRALHESRLELTRREELIERMERQLAEKTDRIHQLQRELNQIGDLKSGAESAGQVLSEKIEMLHTEMAELRDSFNHAREEKRKTEQKNLELLDRMENLAAVHRALEAQCASLETSLAAEREKSAAMRSAESDLQATVGRLQSARAALEERAASLEKEARDLIPEKTALEERLAKLEPMLTQMGDQITTLEKERTQLAEKVESQSERKRDQQAQLEEANRRLQGSISEAQTLHAEKSALHRRLTELVPKLAELEKKVGELERERSKFFSDADMFAQKYRGLEKQLGEAKEQLEGRDQQAGRLQAELEAVSLRVERSVREHEELNVKYVDLESRYERAQRQREELDQAHNEISLRLEEMTRESAEQLRAAAQTRESLETKLSDVQSALADSTSHVDQLEKSSSERIRELEKELSEAKIKTVELAEQAAKQEASVAQISNERDALVAAARRRGTIIVALVILLVIAMAGVFADLMGFDSPWERLGPLLSAL